MIGSSLAGRLHSGVPGVERLEQERTRHLPSLLSHAVVLALGAVLILPAAIGLGWRGAGAGTQPGLGASVAFKAGPGHGPRFELAAIAAEERSDAVTVTRPAAARPRTVHFVPPPGSAGEGLAAIYAVFSGSPGLDWALRVAYCESRYHPNSVNHQSGATGLFQFMPRTWNAHFAGWNIWDPYAQARAALIFYNAGATSAWTCK